MQISYVRIQQHYIAHAIIYTDKVIKSLWLKNRTEMNPFGVATLGTDYRRSIWHRIPEEEFDSQNAF